MCMCTKGFSYPKPIQTSGQTIYAPNQTLNGDGFYVSYNNTDTSIYGSDTTALVDDDLQCFLILNGDHRAEYAQLVKRGYQTCVNYFMDHLDQKSKFSAMPNTRDEV